MKKIPQTAKVHANMIPKIPKVVLVVAWAINMPEMLKKIIRRNKYLQEVESSTTSSRLQEKILFDNEFRVAETEGHEESENTTHAKMTT